MFPKLIAMKDATEAQVRSFVEEKVMPRLTTMRDYILDIVLIPDGNDKERLKPVIIEVNPIGEFAGTGMFDWLKDKPVLLGQKPFEFRTQAIDNAAQGNLSGMDPKWASLVSQFIESRDLMKVV